MKTPIKTGLIITCGLMILGAGLYSDKIAKLIRTESTGHFHKEQTQASHPKQVDQSAGQRHPTNKQPAIEGQGNENEIASKNVQDSAYQNDDWKYQPKS